MINFKIILFGMALGLGGPKVVDYGLASVYYDKIFACRKSTYIFAHLPTIAHRELKCGTIVWVKRIDTEKSVKAIVADRGPFGSCIPSKHNTRACGIGAKWMNAAKYIRQKSSTISIKWRGIIDMTPRLANLLGIKNRLIPIIIYTPSANNPPSVIVQDYINNTLFLKKYNDFSDITKMDGMYGITTSINKSRDQEMAQDFRN